MSLSTAEFISRLDEKGCRGAVLPADSVKVLEKELLSLREAGKIERLVFEKYLARFLYNPGGELPEAASVFIAAVPLLPTEITFEWEGEIKSFVLPPTYVYRDLVEIVRSARDMLDGAGYCAANSRLPLKLLAARSGLGEYGRNNILYVPGMGSFHGLFSFYSDLPPIHSLQEARSMESCDQCAACAGECPTGSIREDSFVIRADRCLTFYNEEEGEMPGWLNPSWHNSLVGCMLCQYSCPENERFICAGREAAEHFTAAETRSILDGAAGDGPLKEKLDRLCLTEYSSRLSRNLRLLLERR